MGTGTGTRAGACPDKDKGGCLIEIISVLHAHQVCFRSSRQFYLLGDLDKLEKFILSM